MHFSACSKLVIGPIQNDLHESALTKAESAPMATTSVRGILIDPLNGLLGAILIVSVKGLLVLL